MNTKYYWHSMLVLILEQIRIASPRRHPNLAGRLTDSMASKHHRAQRILSRPPPCPCDFPLRYCPPPLTYSPSWLVSLPSQQRTRLPPMLMELIPRRKNLATIPTLPRHLSMIPQRRRSLRHRLDHLLRNAHNPTQPSTLPPHRRSLHMPPYRIIVFLPVLHLKRTAKACHSV